MKIVYGIGLLIFLGSAMHAARFQGVNQTGTFITTQILQYPSDIKVDEQALEASATGIFSVPKIPGEYKMLILYPNGTRADRTFMLQHEGDVIGLYGERTEQVPLTYVPDAEAHFITSTSYPDTAAMPPPSYSAEPVTNPWVPGYDDNSTVPTYK
jgi:hypothetical protein